MKKIEAFKRSMIWKFLVKLQRWLMVASSIFVMLIMCLEVLLRYVFKSDLFGIEEIVVIAAFWLYFMGKFLTGFTTKVMLRLTLFLKC